MPDIFSSDKIEHSKDTAPESETGSKEENNKYFYIQDPKGVTPGIFTSFYSFGYKPKGVKFETQDDGEHVVLFLRKHPITNFKWLVIVFALLLFPSIVSLFPGVNAILAQYQILGVLIWYAITITFTLQSFMKWFFDVLIVTDERIIDVDYYDLISKEITDASLDKIQDVTYKVSGVAKTVIDYGDVLVQTASEVPNIDFVAVPKPALVVKILQNLRAEEEVEKIEGRIR
jgi:hypothetical protein